MYMVLVVTMVFSVLVFKNSSKLPVKELCSLQAKPSQPRTKVGPRLKQAYTKPGHSHTKCLTKPNEAIPNQTEGGLIERCLFLRPTRQPISDIKNM